MIEMMKAAIFVEPGKMTVEEVPKATLRQDDDIVIRVVRTCVCGSDLWFFRGLSRQAAHSQVGHESIGVVEEVGAALTISDVMSTGYHAAASADVKPGDTAVVMGDGAVGLCGVIAAKMRGATRIIAMSRHEDRAALAREFGATDIVPERDQAAVDKVLGMTGGYGADAVLECVGSKQSFDTAIGLIRRGGVIGRVGLPHDVVISAEGTFYGNIGIKGGPAPVRHYDLDAGLLDAVLEGRINPGRVFTAEYDLDHIQDAYEAMDQRKVIKALIRL